MFWFLAGVASAFALLWRTSAPTVSPKNLEATQEPREEGMADAEPEESAEAVSGPGEEEEEPAPARPPMNPFKRAAEDRRPPDGFSGSYDDLADADVPDVDVEDLEGFEPEEEEESEGDGP